MTDISPSHFPSIQDMLNALGFIPNAECFVKGNVTFPVVEIVGHTPVTFYARMEKAGWLEEPQEQTELYVWGNQFLAVLSHYLD